MITESDYNRSAGLVIDAEVTSQLSDTFICMCPPGDKPAAGNSTLQPLQPTPDQLLLMKGVMGYLVVFLSCFFCCVYCMSIALFPYLMVIHEFFFFVLSVTFNFMHFLLFSEHSGQMSEL